MCPARWLGLKSGPLLHSRSRTRLPHQVTAPTHLHFGHPSVSSIDRIFTALTPQLISQSSCIRRVVFVIDDCDVHGLDDRFERIATSFGVGVVLLARGGVDDSHRFSSTMYIGVYY